MEMHIHDCYEVYYSISGGKQFVIGGNIYSVTPGDLFIINQYESHKLSDIDSNTHERIVLHFHPNYIKALSTSVTDLDECFSNHPAHFQHRISLEPEAREKFLNCVDRITSADSYGSDIVQRIAILEILLLLNRRSSGNACSGTASVPPCRQQVSEILDYINCNLSRQLTTQALAEYFYMSQSYLCRIFKEATGTTINKYITARRIAMAKVLLNQGHNVSETYEDSGFATYVNFYKAFTKAVGLPPKKYGTLCDGL